MAWSIRNKKHGHLHWMVWAILVASVVAVLAWPKLKGRYHRWTAAWKVRDAAESIAHGDFKRAILGARSVLETSPLDIGATEIMARALEGAGSAVNAVPWRSRLETLRPGEQKNLLAWADDSMKTGDATAAERILGLLNPEPSENAGYHAVAAEVATAKRDDAGAERHWAEASRIDPKEDGYRVKLAASRLTSKSPAVRAGAVAVLMVLSAKPTKAADALRVLLADATNIGDWTKAREYADLLVATRGAIFPDKLTRLSLLRQIKAPDATGYLTDLRSECLKNPPDLYMLLMWMNQHDLALIVTEWARTLPGEIFGRPPVCVAVADAYVRSSDWRALLAFLDEHQWAEWECMRRAFLARAAERLDDAARSAQEWKDGIAAARGRADSKDRLERMVRLAIGWGWEQRAQEVMWGMVGTPGCPRWMLDALWLIATEEANTGRLQKLAGLLAKAEPKSAVFRTHHAFYSLLTHSEEGDPHREAERLFHENRGDTAIVLTRGLSLYQQGKAAEAAALTGSLPAKEMQKPQVALYHAIFLTATGEGAKAREFAAVAQGRKMFPEEKAMLERARQEAAKAAEEGSIVERSRAIRAAKAALDLEKEKAVEEARAVRATKATREAHEAAALQKLNAASPD